MGSIPGRGTKTPHAMQRSQKIKDKEDLEHQLIKVAEKNIVCSQLATSAMHKDTECGCLAFLTNYCLLCCHPSFHSPVAQTNSTLYNNSEIRAANTTTVSS